MAIGAGATFVMASASYVLVAQRRIRELFLINLGVFGLAIAASASLIPLLGARGGAICSALLDVALVAGYTIVLRRQRIGPSTSFLARFALALALGVGVGVAGLQIHPVVAVIVGTAAYFATLWFTDAIPSELIDAIPSWAKVWKHA